jgi:fluoroquinolone transport system permease protein
MAPLAALALAALAANKVQGLALMKAAGVVLIPPMIAYFLPAPWRLVFALTPTWRRRRCCGAWKQVSRNDRVLSLLAHVGNGVSL